MNNQPNMPRKGTRRALGAAVTVAVVAVVLACNILFSFVADRLMWQVDETVTRYTTRPGVSMYTVTEELDLAAMKQAAAHLPLPMLQPTVVIHTDRAVLVFLRFLWTLFSCAHSQP